MKEKLIQAIPVLIGVLLAFILGIFSSRAQDPGEVLSRFLQGRMEITYDTLITVDTVDVVLAYDTTVVVDTVLVDAVPTEFERFADDTSYEVYEIGSNRLVILYSNQDNPDNWQAVWEDSVYTYSRFFGYIPLHRIAFSAMEQFGQDLSANIDMYATFQNAYLKKESAEEFPPIEDPDPLPDPDDPEPPFVSWVEGEDLNLGPVPVSGSFFVRTEVIPESIGSWQRIVGKIGSSAPFHFWTIEMGPGGVIWFRVRMGGQLISTNTGTLESGVPAIILATYNAQEITLNVNGASSSAAVVGDRNTGPSIDTWVWLPGAPDARVFTGTISYVNIYD